MQLKLVTFINMFIYFTQNISLQSYLLVLVLDFAFFYFSLGNFFISRESLNPQNFRLLLIYPKLDNHNIQNKWILKKLSNTLIYFSKLIFKGK